MPLYLMVVTQLGGRSEGTHMTWYCPLFLRCLGVCFTMRCQAAANLTILIPLLFLRHRDDSIRHKNMPVTDQISMDDF